MSLNAGGIKTSHNDRKSPGESGISEPKCLQKKPGEKEPYLSPRLSVGTGKGLYRGTSSISKKILREGGRICLEIKKSKPGRAEENLGTSDRKRERS